MRGILSIALVAAMFLAAGCRPSGEDTAPPAAPPPSAPAAVTPPASSSASLAGRDVVIVVVDGLRADRAADPAAAPFISSLAAQGLTFTNTASNSSHVLQSLASFFTGRLPTRGGSIGVYEAEPHDESKTIAQFFQDAGYYTGLLANHPAIQGKGFTKGFEDIQVAQAGQPLDDAALTKRAGEFFEDAGTGRAFLYIHFAGPLASKLYRQDDTSATGAAAAPFSLREFGQKYAALLPGKPIGNEPFRERIEATEKEYTAAVTSANTAVKSLVETLRASGRAEKSLLVVTSLHGFELFEHGYLGAGWTLFEEAVRVPLIFYAPGAIPARADAQAVSLVDVMPSVLTLAGLQHASSGLDGQSLFEAQAGAIRVNESNRPRIAEVVIPERCVLRTVTQDGWTYLASSLWADPKDRYAIAEAHRDTANAYLDGSRQPPPLWGAAAKEALFNGPVDAELPLAENEQARAPLAMMLEEYRERCEKSGLAPRTAVKSVKALNPEQIENLESLGYL
jgi:arylsulfatase A-like enzyme